ncbi:MAG TPA: ABATE domain-containing protein [Candidatus Udaeobacter sp.]|nr:ABATE domain-containing protein [Candidatus Udaeobacter sp.]
MHRPLPASNAPLNPSRAGRLDLLGGALCLNFANTTSGRGSDHNLEHLQRYDHLLAWAAHAGAMDQTACKTLAVLANRRPRAADGSLLRAVHLRESLHGIFTAAIAGAAPPALAMGDLNSTLAEAMAAASILPTATGFAWTWADLTSSLDCVLWPVVRSAAELLTGPRLERLKACPGLHCGWLFLDRTRNGRRRWCEMEVCGSRAKMRRYRQRRQTADMDPGAVPG